MSLLGTSVDILKRVALMAFIMAVLVSVGELLNQIIPWEYLGYFFGFIRRLVLPVDFMWDTTTMLVLIGLSLFVEAAIWGVRGLLALIKLVGWNK
jgi:hypothetical protein